MTGHGGLQGLLFRSPGKDKEKAWETRTAKNLRENVLETGDKEVWAGGANMLSGLSRVLTSSRLARVGAARHEVPCHLRGREVWIFSWVGLEVSWE